MGMIPVTPRSKDTPYTGRIASNMSKPSSAVAYRIPSEATSDTGQIAELIKNQSYTLWLPNSRTLNKL